MRTRDCCGTTYDRDHPETCPVRGATARAVLPHEPTPDGWCANHSTGAGPAYCKP